jgi:hypothetical protein
VVDKRLIFLFQGIKDKALNNMLYYVSVVTRVKAVAIT